MRSGAVVLASAMAFGCGASTPRPRAPTGDGATPRCERDSTDVGAEEFVASGMSLTTRLRLEAGQRWAVQVVATRGLVDVDLEAYDADGSLLASDHGPDASPRLLLGGGTRGGDVLLVARVVQGAGRLSFDARSLEEPATSDRFADWDPSAVGELGHSPLPAEDAFLARAGLRTVRYDGRVSVPAAGDLRLALDAAPGTCLGVLVTTAAARPVAIELQSSEGRALARSGSEEGTAVAAFCPDRRGEAAIVVVADGGTMARLVVRQGDAAQVEGLEPLVETSGRGPTRSP